MNVRVFQCYACSSPQINNRPFRYDCEERKERERTHYTSERKRKQRIEMKKKKKEKREKKEKAIKLYNRCLLSA